MPKTSGYDRGKVRVDVNQELKDEYVVWGMAFRDVKCA